MEESSASTNGIIRSDDPMTEYDRVALATAGDVDDNIEEMTAFFKARLKHSLSEWLIKMLFEIQIEFRNRQAALIDQLNSDKITRERYLDEFNAALRLSMEESRSLLGQKDFALVYGEAGFHPESLVDREAFISGHG
jgi:hypothetical protein